MMNYGVGDWVVCIEASSAQAIKYFKVGGKYCVDTIVLAGEIRPGGTKKMAEDTVGILSIPSPAPDGLTWGWDATRFKLYDPPKPEAAPMGTETPVSVTP